MHQQMIKATGESKILIIVTGGTICMVPSDDGLVTTGNFLNEALRGHPSFDDTSKLDLLQVKYENGQADLRESLRTPVSIYRKQVRYCTLEFQPLLDSSSIDADSWDKIARTIYANYDTFDGFVVLHGTDSLAFTAAALSFMLENLAKPVILTGSQAPIYQLHNDGAGNLLGALVLAGHFVIPEVCLFFNHSLFRGNRCTKVSVSQFAAFSSPNLPPIATIESQQAKVNWNLVHRPNGLNKLTLHGNLKKSQVACLRIFPGITPNLIEAVLQVEGLRGLVLETFGAGNIPDGDNSEISKVLEKAVKSGIVIVCVTQCLSGSVSSTYASGSGMRKAGVACGFDMTSEAALTKLLYLLAQPDSNPRDTIKLMSVDLRGELTPFQSVSFSQPDLKSPITMDAPGFIQLKQYINEGNIKQIEQLVQCNGNWLLYTKDKYGDTAVHSAARVKDSQVLAKVLQLGGSLHIRNFDKHTPLFIAAAKGLEENVRLLQTQGAEFYSEEVALAKSTFAKLKEDREIAAATNLQAPSDVIDQIDRKMRCWRLTGISG